MVISDFLSVFVGALFVLRGALTFGGYLAFVNTFWRAVTTTMQLLNQVPEFQRLGVITDRVAAFLVPAATTRVRTSRAASCRSTASGSRTATRPCWKDVSMTIGAERTRRHRRA